MSWYIQKNDSWPEQPAPADSGLSIQVRADDTDVRPSVRVLSDDAEHLHLTGTDPRPNTDTTHTVARVEPGEPGVLLFAVHAQGNDLIFEDLRTTEAPNQAFEQVQSALNEIMIPVYIDDVISDLSETRSGLILLHTAQYASETADAWTYFRTSVFENGELALDAERGSM